MLPDNSFLDKIDPQLQEKLAYAPENEILRVIVRLSGDNQSNINSNSISPVDFPNRTEYRKALIAQRQQQLSGDIGTTKKAIENLALKTYGGKNTKTLVVEGTVNQILHSLELSGIESATLDRGFSPISPSPDSYSNNSLESIFLEIAEEANIISTARINRLAKFLERSNFDAEENTKQVIYQASQRYIANYYEKYGIIKVLGMTKAISLDSIYTDVRLLEKNEVSRVTSIAELESSYRKTNRELFPNSSSTTKGLDIANQERYLMVLGSPGSGKSTFLRKVALEAIRQEKQSYHYKCIPVLLELRQFINSDIDINQAIVEEFEISSFPHANKIVMAALKKGKLLILLDGIDEMYLNSHHSAVDTIQKFVKNYNKNRFIISCRTTGYQNSFNDFTHVEIAYFNDDQIEQYINNWFNSEIYNQEENAINLWSLLQKTQHNKIKELAITPLLLNFICLVYSNLRTLPYSLSHFYHQALQILLKEWTVDKRNQQNEIYQHISPSLEEILLSEIAYYNFINDKLFFSKKEIILQIDSFFSSNLNNLPNINGEAVLNAIEVQQGILVEQADRIYSFSHRTFQEYLAAKYIVDHNLIENTVSSNLTDTRWQEVFKLVAGLIKADNLLLLMEKEAQKLIINNNLRDLLCWADRVVNRSNDEYKLAVKRALAIYLAIIRNRSLDLAISLNYDLDLGRNPNFINKVNNIKSALNLLKHLVIDIPIAYEVLNYHSSSWMPNDMTRDIARAISRINSFKALKIFTDDINLEILLTNLENLKSKVPNESLPGENYIEFSNEIRQLWMDTFKLEKNWINLTNQEIQSLSDYIETQLLTLKCKEAAVQISTKTWEGIESRMLLPIENTIS